MSKYVKNTIALELARKLTELGIQFKFGEKIHILDSCQSDKEVRAKTTYTSGYSFEIESRRGFVLLDLGYTVNENDKIKGGYKIRSISKKGVREKGYFENSSIIIEKTHLEDKHWDAWYIDEDKHIVAEIENWVEQFLNLIILYMD